MKAIITSLVLFVTVITSGARVKDYSRIDAYAKATPKIN